MIKTLRWKFIFAAMASLLIVIIILVGGMTLLGYRNLEETADSMLQLLASDVRAPGATGKMQFPAFGYQIDKTPLPTGYFVAVIDENAMIISIENIGLTELSENETVNYINEALASGNRKGKIGPYKYLIKQESNRPLRVAFLDNSVQVQTLAHTILSACVAGFICLILMFIILYYISGRVIQPIVRNIEKQQQFVSNAGHEIKTPLGIIMANTDALELYLGENKWSRNIRGQVKRMHGLTNQLLLLARMDEGATLPFDTVNLSNLVKEVKGNFLESAMNKQIQIQTQIADGVSLQGNQDNLEQLINILLDNAVKYANNGGDISIKLAVEGRKTVLTVENSLEQLPSVPPAALFDRFYRANAARTQKDGGYGIGLSAARAIAKMHNGKIEASYLGKHHICFTVEFS